MQGWCLLSWVNAGMLGVELGECRDGGCWAVMVQTSFTFFTLTSLAFIMVLTRHHPLFSLLQPITHGSLLFQAEYSPALYKTTLFLHSSSKCICSWFFFSSLLCLLLHMYLKILEVECTFDLRDCLCFRYESSLFGLQLVQMAVRL